MIRVRPTLLEDFRRINAREGIPYTFADCVNVFIHSNSIMTAEREGYPLFIADSKPYEDGLYIWALADESFVKHYRAVVARIKRWLGLFNHSVVYAHVKDGDEPGRKFIRFLGFQLDKLDHLELKGAKFHRYKRAM
jgi:hypothetical protein